MDAMNSLANLFSDAAKQKFARVINKPQPAVVEVAEDAPEEESELAEADEAALDGQPREDDQTANERTVFVGNVPITESQKSLEKLFGQFGAVESVRLRSVPIEGAKVDDAGNQSLVRKICINKKKFGEQKGSFNAYIKFKSADSVAAALTLNNHLLGSNPGRHLRVDRSNPTVFHTKLTVFIGNVPYYADEEELRAHFAAVLPNGQTDIEGVRLVRDAETLVGKGFGYILFKSKEALVKALGLHDAKFKDKWALRVTTCSAKKSHAPRTDRSNKKKEEGGASQGVKAVKLTENASHALKRIKKSTKNVMTKKKLLKSRGQSGHGGGAKGNGSRGPRGPKGANGKGKAAKASRPPRK